MALRLKVIGYEKFWSILTGGGMATAVATLVLWVTSPIIEGAQVPSPETITAAIVGVVITIFNAFNVLLTADTILSDEVVGVKTKENSIIENHPV